MWGVDETMLSHFLLILPSMKQITLTIYILLSIIICIPLKGSCCNCAGTLGLSEAIHVFIGEVVAMEKKTNPQRIEITFTVRKYVKGPLKENTIKVNVCALEIACCGYAFNFYDVFQVYTYEENGLLYTGHCTQTHVAYN